MHATPNLRDLRRYPHKYLCIRRVSGNAPRFDYNFSPIVKCVGTISRLVSFSRRIQSSSSTCVSSLSFLLQNPPVKQLEWPRPAPGQCKSMDLHWTDSVCSWSRSSNTPTLGHPPLVPSSNLHVVRETEWNCVLLISSVVCTEIRDGQRWAGWKRKQWIAASNQLSRKNGVSGRRVIGTQHRTKMAQDW